MSEQKHLIVIGGGAGGFFCAVNAAKMHPGLSVTIVEKSNKLLSKVKISGGGRCNTTHACFEIPELVNKYPRGRNFIKKSFHWFNTNHTIEWFAARGVQLKTETDGRMFPDTDRSQTIIDCLLHEAEQYGIRILMQTEVVRLEPDNGGWKIQTSDSRQMVSNYICVATGGYPKSSMFNWLQQLGHTIEEPVPSLFTFNMPGNNITQLMGVSVEKAKVKIAGTKLMDEGPLLITHWGMSGPVILRLSAWGARQLAEIDYRFSVVVNWLSVYNEQGLRADWQRFRDAFASQKITGKNPFGLPTRLWLYILSVCDVADDKRWSDISSEEKNKLIKNLVAQEFVVNGKTTFKEEFVTCGGIFLSEINPNTMESRIHPGLFFAGEVMDVDGITGGFNFQHAWTSGWIAAKSIAGMCAERK